VTAILESLDRRRAGATAPAHGLTLARIRYDEAAGGASGDASPVW
jgi:hypothetical protein